MLIPFYIFTHEKKFPEYDSSEQKLQELEAEYQMILTRLDVLEKTGMIDAFDKRTIIELSRDVAGEIATNYENVQKGVGDLMRGALIETEARTILNRGKREGREETQRETALRMLKMGKLTIEEISQCSGLDIEQVEQLGRN